MQNPVLPTSQQRRKNSVISLQKRIKLTELVLHENKSLIKTAKFLNIKLSTAKLIVKKYKQTGTFYESQKAKAIRLSQSQKIQPQKIDSESDVKENAPIKQEPNRPNQPKQVPETVIASGQPCYPVWMGPTYPFYPFAQQYPFQQTFQYFSTYNNPLKQFFFSQ